MARRKIYPITEYDIKSLYRRARSAEQWHLCLIFACVAGSLADDSLAELAAACRAHSERRAKANDDEIRRLTEGN